VNKEGSGARPSEQQEAHRLAADTPVYEQPDRSSAVEEVLPAGSLVTVYERAGDFIHVVTPNDKFGYIAADSAFVQLQGPGAAAAAAEEHAARGSDPAAAGTAAPGGAAAMAAAPADDGYTPVSITAPAERVLIWDRIEANKRNTFLLLALFGIFLAALFSAIGIFITYYFGLAPGQETEMAVGIAIAAAIVGGAIGVMLYFTAPAAVLSISGAHEVSREQEPELYRIVENLSIGLGLPMPKLWVIEDSAPNAFATGRDPRHAHVAATRGLLEKLSRREIEAVMAHEMSHVGNYDIRIMTIAAVAVGLVALVADFILRFTWYGAGARPSNRGKGGGAIGLIILAIAVIFIILSPIIASLLRLAVSRQREYLADASGALLCRNPEALASALEKIAADREPLEAANKATAHLYIENPLKEHSSFLNRLFSTHPPVEERIRLLRAMG
jgi:heat shock protein HtpX